jgi:hypothetical protein
MNRTAALRRWMPIGAAGGRGRALLAPRFSRASRASRAARIAVVNKIDALCSVTLAAVPRAARRAA